MLLPPSPPRRPARERVQRIPACGSAAPREPRPAAAVAARQREPHHRHRRSRAQGNAERGKGAVCCVARRCCAVSRGPPCWCRRRVIAEPLVLLLSPSCQTPAPACCLSQGAPPAELAVIQSELAAAEKGRLGSHQAGKHVSSGRHRCLLLRALCLLLHLPAEECAVLYTPDPACPGTSRCRPSEETAAQDRAHCEGSEQTGLSEEVQGRTWNPAPMVHQHALPVATSAMPAVPLPATVKPPLPP